MARLIDTLPSPQRVLPTKVIVLSRSRSGTLSLYKALKILGYRAYHGDELFSSDDTHMKLLEEAARCKFLGEGKPYGKAEFDKWFADYDALMAVPQYFFEEFLEFYPDAKFILTERDFDSWIASMSNTVCAIMRDVRSPPLNELRTVDPWIDSFCSLHSTFEEILFHGKGVDDGIEDAKRDYLNRQERVEALGPRDNLVVCRLEDGIGWEQICPLLGHEIPTTAYPRTNTPGEFQTRWDGLLGIKVKKALESGICEA